jgi:hypothetical protein
MQELFEAVFIQTLDLVKGQIQVVESTTTTKVKVSWFSRVLIKTGSVFGWRTWIESILESLS